MFSQDCQIFRFSEKFDPSKTEILNVSTNRIHRKFDPSKNQIHGKFYPSKNRIHRLFRFLK